VDFIPGTPEENLGHFRTRIARFGANYGVRLHAPFRGRWFCSQGVDGEHTHRGPWRHAADFEVLGADGRTHRGRGQQREDYHCYRLPVLATADGTVVRVVDGVPDNAIGEVDLAERWGNLVLLLHGPGLYSLVAHLAPGSVRVQEGQVVRRGDPLGQCGSSGRSPVPHLHFHLQATPLVGAPTIHLELHEVVAGPADREELRNTCVPARGQQLRNVEPQRDLAHTLRFEVGRTVTLRCDGREEAVTPEMGLLGEQMLRSPRATLYFEHGERLWTVLDVLGSRRSALHLVRACLARVPFEPTGGLTWKDHLPARHVLPWHQRLLLARNRDGRDGIPMRYAARAEGERIVITGTSLPCTATGSPLVRTEAVLLRGKGIERLSLRAAGRAREATHEIGRTER
jgi:murein DD-endopeptidase MepM/ murein hydrolase activator NlpD